MIGVVGQQVATNIKAIRTANRITYEELASLLMQRDCKIPVIGLRRIENLQRHVNVDELVAFCRVFGLTREAITLPLERPVAVLAE